MAVIGTVDPSAAFAGASTLVASLAGLLAYRQSRRQNTGEVGVARDEGNWQRMLDSIKRADEERLATAKELGEVRTELIQVRADSETQHTQLITVLADNEALRARVADVEAHARNCDDNVARLEKIISEGKP